MVANSLLVSSCHKLLNHCNFHTFITKDHSLIVAPSRVVSVLKAIGIQIQQLHVQACGGGFRSDLDVLMFAGDVLLLAQLKCFGLGLNLP